MKKCPKCRALTHVSNMMCRCGHSFVEKASERPWPRVLATNTGCFVSLFSANFLLGAAATWILVSADADLPYVDNPNFKWFPLIDSIPSLVAAIGLSMRRRFGYTLGMVLCGINILSIPFGTIIAIVLMTGLSRDRHLFDA